MTFHVEPRNYNVIEFMTSHSEADRYTCVPRSWILWWRSMDRLCCVLYPNELFTDASIMKILEANEPLSDDKCFPYIAKLMYSHDNLSAACDGLNMLLHTEEKQSHSSWTPGIEELDVESQLGNMPLGSIDVEHDGDDFMSPEQYPSLEPNEILRNEFYRKGSDFLKYIHNMFIKLDQTMKSIIVFNKLNLNNDGESAVGNMCSNNCELQLPIRSPKNKLRRPWIFKFPESGEDLIELVPGSGIYVKSIELSRCRNKAKNCNELGNYLMSAIFSERALHECCWSGRSYIIKTKDIQTGEWKFRYGLDKHAKDVLLYYVQEYAKKKNWYFCVNSIIAYITHHRCKLYINTIKGVTASGAHLQDGNEGCKSGNDP